MAQMSSITSLGATLALTLCLCAASLASEESRQEQSGVRVLIPNVCTPEQERQQGDGRPLWIRLLPDGLTYINQEQISRGEVISRLTAEMSTRQERIVFLQADSVLHFGEVVEVAASLQSQIRNLTIALITSSQISHSTPFRCFALASLRDVPASNVPASGNLESWQLTN